MIMFIGSIVGGVVQCGQIFLQAASLYSDNVADWLNWRDGSVLMVLTTAFIFPVRPALACHEHHHIMRKEAFLGDPGGNICTSDCFAKVLLASYMLSAVCLQSSG